MNAQVKITNRAGASFPVRRMSFDFDQVSEYWMNGSAGLTHFMTALCTIPGRRKFFIDSVRACTQQLKTMKHCKRNFCLYWSGSHAYPGTCWL